jgi:subtilisin family serine protease
MNFLTDKSYFFLVLIVLLVSINFLSFSSIIAFSQTGSTTSTTDIVESQLTTGLDRIDGESIIRMFDSAPLDIDIAIMDTGIESDHPDLNVFNQHSVLDDSNPEPSDSCDHGTHVAGIAAAKNNDVGVVGVAPGAKLWSIKISECDPTTGEPNAEFGAMMRGLDYVLANADEIDVLNISQNTECLLVGCAQDDDYQTKINELISRGVVVVNSAGNNGENAVNYLPSRIDDVITVSAISDTDGKCGGLGPMSSDGEDDTLARQSNVGDVVDIAAPGIDINSTILNGQYGIKSGTSMAAPYVAGTAALIKANNQGITPDEVLNTILDNAVALGTPCDIEDPNNDGHGYFEGDRDNEPEPLLYIKNIITN